ncbi:flagellar basal body-associated FliL family protein [Porticoccaceae bacterium]|nr:flagellar basal body-associated FliL family protein [Porticoccaceae bacterium]MDC1512934.1 flagellar basal body-associated FliL family protein [Porticoccaceae bacterium]
MIEENVEEEKAKSPIVKIILIVVGILLLVAITVGGTLFASGFFDANEGLGAEEAIAALEAEAAAQAEAEAAAAAGPDKVKLDSPELTRFEPSYFVLPKVLVANISNSRKVMQATVAIMTHYDERVVDNVDKHDFPLRFAMLKVMRNVTEAEVADKDFQDNLAAELKTEMNAVLEGLEDFGGIEAVYFTEFVVQ